MRISVEIDENTVAELMNLTGEKSRSAAIARGATEFMRRTKMKEFGRLMVEGAFDYPTSTPEEDAIRNPIPPLRWD